jgi:hypothetical protein
MDSRTRLGLLAALIPGGSVLALGVCLVLVKPGPGKIEPGEPRPAARQEVRPVRPVATAPHMAQVALADVTRPQPAETSLPLLAPTPPLLLPSVRPTEVNNAEPLQEEAPAPLPEEPVADGGPRPARQGPIDARITSPPEEKKESIDVIKDLLKDHLTGALSFQVERYSDPVRIRFQGRKAEIVRVIYKVDGGDGKGRAADQLFMVSKGKVKQQVNTADWLAKVQYEQMQRLAAAQQELAEQQLAEAEYTLAQTSVGSSLANGYVAQRVHGPCHS